MNPATERDPAKNPMAWLMPRALPDLVALGGSPGFIQYVPEHDHPSGLPATRFQVNHGLLKKFAHLPVTRALFDMMGGQAGPTASAILEIYSALAHGGPKLFEPSEEQFEAMEQVEVSIPVDQYRQPYPALAVKLPLGCRARLARELGLPVADVPFWVVVRHRRGLDPQDVVLAHLGSRQLGDTFYVFQANPRTPTVEAAISRDAGSDGTIPKDLSGALHKFGHRATRAALNLAIMLTRVPTHLAGPPAAKNREERRARELGGQQSFRVIPDQEITVRGSAYRKPHQGGEAAHQRGGPPRWVKGHWRAHPGHGEARARGEQVPLVFISPYLVGADQTEPGTEYGSTTYRG